MPHSIPMSHVLSICNLDSSLLFTKWRHHIGTTSEKNSTMLFPLRSGLHTQMHPSPFSGRPSNFSLTICQSKPHFCAKSLAWKERHESQVVDLSDQAWLQDFYQNLSLASNGSQTGSKKLAHAFPAIRQSVTFITAYYCMSVDPGEQATQHLQLISPVHNSKEKGKTTDNKQPFSSFPGDAPASCSCPNGHVPAPGTTTCRSQWCSRSHSDKPGYRAMATNHHHSNACPGCCACFAFGKGCTTGCTTGFGKGLGCTAFGGGAAAASLGLNSEKMWKESAGPAVDCQTDVSHMGCTFPNASLL